MVAREVFPDIDLYFYEKLQIYKDVKNHNVNYNDDQDDD
jgi:hypothetical protein